MCVPVVTSRAPITLDAVSGVLGNSLVWLMLYGMLGLLARMSGAEHPPFEPGPLSLGRKALAWLCLLLLVLLFMPTPMAIYP